MFGSSYPAHMQANVCTDETVTPHSLSSFQVERDSLLFPPSYHQPLCPEISILETLIPVWHLPICPAVSLLVGTRSSGPVEAIKAPV